MTHDITPHDSGGSPFDAIRRTDDHDGTEFWSARELMPLLGYEKWERFSDSIARARITCGTTGHAEADHFPSSGKKVSIGSGAEREVSDFNLTRFGAYLVAMNGDPRKPEVAAAQAYFAIRTREAETAETKRPDVAQLPDRRELAQWVIEAENKAEREKKARIEAESRARELEAPASAWSHLAQSAGDYEVADAAKVLSRDPAISIGRDRLFRFMAIEGWIFRNNSTGRWKAYQTQIDNGRLTEKLGRPYLHEPTGQMRNPDPTIRITAKGLAELHKRLGGSGQLPILSEAS